MQYMLLIYEDESLYGNAGKVRPALQEEIVARHRAFNRAPVADSAEGSVEREPLVEAQGPPVASGTRSSSDTMPPEAVFARRGAVSCRNKASTRPTT